MRILPFRPLIPKCNETAKSLTCPPYDVLSVSEAQLFARNDNSFVYVTRPDAVHPDLKEGSDELYQAAKVSLEKLEESGDLIRESERCFYVYQQQCEGRTQRGLVALVQADDYRNNVIRKHEKTRPDKEKDRTRLTDVLSANVGPVFLTYRDVTGVSDIVNKVVAGHELFDVTAEGAVAHRVWRVPAELQESIEKHFENVDMAYIADGHHRAASAATVAAMRGGGEFLAVLFPAGELNIMPYNRVVKDLNGMSKDEFVSRLGECGGVSTMEEPRDVPECRGVVFVYVGDNWFRLELREEEGALAERLDCAVLQKRVLAPLLAITDPRKSERIDFVGGIEGVAGVMKRVQNGVGFVIHPVSVAELMQVSDEGGIMPPKSTWFEPKLRSGFFVHTF